MAVKSLCLLPGGKLLFDQGLMTHRSGMGTPVVIPVFSTLVTTDEGLILFDTGLDPNGLTDSAATWGIKKDVIHEFQPEDDIRYRLHQVGVTPEDIRWVVNSHLHYDHTGGNRFFSEAEFLVQASEYRYALFPDDFFSGAYIKSHFDQPFNYRLIEGPVEVTDGVYLWPTPGHTPGSQIMLVRLPKTGTIIITGDAMYCRENAENSVPPSDCWNMSEAVKSIKVINQLVRMEKAELLIPHDPNAERIFRLYPEKYE